MFSAECLLEDSRDYQNKVLDAQLRQAVALERIADALEGVDTVEFYNYGQCHLNSKELSFNDDSDDT